MTGTPPAAGLSRRGPTPPGAASACIHCAAAMEPGSGEYCCSGCEMAAAIIHGAGLDAYYERRETAGGRPELAGGSWDTVPVEPGPGSTCTAMLAVDGLSCSACVWVTERVLQTTPGVLSASVSYATGRTRLSWDPAIVDLATIAGRIAAIGYRPRPLVGEVTPDRGLLLRLGVSAFCSVNIMLLSASLYAGWFDGISDREAALMRWAALALATPIALWCAEPLFRGAIAGLRQRVLHMDLPVSIGIVAMYGQGIYATLTAGDPWLDSLGMLVTLLLGGRLLEQRGRRNAAEAALALGSATPRTARRGGVEVPASELRAGDLIDIGLGEEVPADGVIEATGAGPVRARMAILTGESEPVAVGMGDALVTGAVLDAGSVTLRVQATGAETLLARMARAVAEASDHPAPPSVTDRIAPWFTGATLVLAVLALAFGGPGRAMAVLVVACPCALSLAGPLSTAAGLGAAARRGLLVRTGDALRNLAEVQIIAFDKTGTLTTGLPAVVDVEVSLIDRPGNRQDTSAWPSTQDHVVRIAAALERASAHPAARAIRGEAARRGIALAASTGLHEEPGVGVVGEVDGQLWSLGAGGPGEVVLRWQGVRVGALRLRDTLRPDADRTVAALKGLGYRVVLLTGDHADVAGRIAAEAGVDEVVAGATPEMKAAWVRAQAGGVLVVGDGVNDGPALAASRVGVAMGTGVASTVTVADAVIAHDGLGPVVAGLRAAAAAKRAVRGNAGRSVAYNTLAVSAAMVGLVNPLVAAVLMPLSSAMVAWGAAGVEREMAGPSAKGAT